MAATIRGSQLDTASLDALKNAADRAERHRDQLAANRSLGRVDMRWLSEIAVGALRELAAYKYQQIHSSPSSGADILDALDDDRR